MLVDKMIGTNEDRYNNDAEVDGVSYTHTSEETYTNLKKENCFGHTQNMAKVIEGDKGGGIYVAVFQDRNTKKSQIGIVIKYPDMEESELLRFSSGEFLQAGQRAFEERKHDKKGCLKNNKLTFTKRFENTLMDYNTPDMVIYPNFVLRVIYEKYNMLPIVKEFEKEAGIDEIYKVILVLAEELSEREDKAYIKHDDYFRFRRDDMNELAKILDMNTQSLVNSLSTYGLINRTQNSPGHQTKINFRGMLIYTYNICKKSHLIQVDVKKNFEGEFPTLKFDKKYLSPSEQYRLKKEEAEKEFISKMKITDWAKKELLVEFGIVEKKDIIPENCKIEVIIKD